MSQLNAETEDYDRERTRMGPIDKQEAKTLRDQLRQGDQKIEKQKCQLNRAEDKFSDQKKKYASQISDLEGKCTTQEKKLKTVNERIAALEASSSGGEAGGSGGKGFFEKVVGAAGAAADAVGDALGF